MLFSTLIGMVSGSAAGDVLVQRGNNHAWSNRGDEPCVIAFVLVDGVTRRDAPKAEQKGKPRRP